MEWKAFPHFTRKLKRIFHLVKNNAGLRKYSTYLEYPLNIPNNELLLSQDRAIINPTPKIDIKAAPFSCE